MSIYMYVYLFESAREKIVEFDIKSCYKNISKIHDVSFIFRIYEFFSKNKKKCLISDYLLKNYFFDKFWHYYAK